MLGIVNTLTVSIADRRRELGVLRAVGGLRAQIRRTVWMEAVAIGIIGLVLGIVVGTILLYYELQAIVHDFTGMPLDYQFPTAHRRHAGARDPRRRAGIRHLARGNRGPQSLVEALEYE